MRAMLVVMLLVASPAWAGQGFYLMVPLGRMPTAPLSQWTRATAFDTAKECEDFRAELVRMGQRADDQGWVARDEAELREWFHNIRCVSADDPALVPRGPSDDAPRGKILGKNLPADEPGVS